MQFALGNDLRQTLGEHRHAVPAALGAALDDRPDEHVGDLVQADLVFLTVAGELLGNHGQVGPGGLGDAQGQRAGLASHGHDEVPAPRGARIEHQVAHELGAQMARRLKTEGIDVRRQVEVVVDGLGHVHHAQARAGALGHLHRRKCGVVAADGDQLGDTQLAQRLHDPVQVRRLLGRIGARGAQDRATLQVDAAHILGRQAAHAIELALHDLRISVGQPQHLLAGGARAQGHGADHAVEPGRGSAADEHREFRRARNLFD
jgi:hypothetical protein